MDFIGLLVHWAANSLLCLKRLLEETYKILTFTQVGSDDDGYAVRLKYKDFVRYSFHGPTQSAHRFLSTTSALRQVNFVVFNDLQIVLQKTFVEDKIDSIYLFRYMHDADHGKDDSPLYIFDGSFAEKKGSRGMRHDFSIPPQFAEDLMQWGGEKRRPPYRHDFSCLQKIYTILANVIVEDH